MQLESPPNRPTESEKQESADAIKTSSINTNKVIPSNKGEVKGNNKKRFEKNDFGFPKLPLGIQYKEIIIFICWIAAIAFTIWFIIDVVNHYTHALHNPVTSLSLVEHVPMAFPAVTICNYNALKHCDTCGLSLEHVTRVLENGSIIDYEVHSESKIIEDFHCVVINNDTHHPIPDATLTGYGASYSLFFHVPQMPNNIYTRYGLQVSFHKQGTVPDVVSETNFAMAGVDNFFILTKYHTKYLDTHSSGSTESSNTATHSILSSGGGDSTTTTGSETSSSDEIRWKASLAAVGLTEHEEDIIVVSFAYATLNQYEVEEILPITIETVLGEIGAIIGVLAGLDVMKIIRGFIEIPFAIPVKSLRPIWEIFN